jgi:hypothetical protein
VKAAETLRAIQWCLRQMPIRGGAIWFTDAVVSCTEAKIIPFGIRSLDDYSKFMLHHLPLYGDLFTEDHILVVQPDSLIVNPAAWHDFLLEYDYIGAPWPDGTVGNGGFSLRSRRLLDCLHRLSWEVSHTPRQNKTEDWIISRELRGRLEFLGCRFPSAADAARFSTEPRPDHPYKYEGSFGVHGSEAIKAALECVRRDGSVAV